MVKVLGMGLALIVNALNYAMRFRFLLLASIVVLSGCAGNTSIYTGPLASTVAGSDKAGYADGPISTALFSNPVNVAVSSEGTIYVCDFDNDKVRAISPSGDVTTLTSQALFQRPFGIALSASGKLYVQTDDNDLGAHSSTTGTVWQINRSTGVATMVAHNLGRPRGLAVLRSGTIVLSDVSRSTVKLLDPSTGGVTLLAGQDGVPGFADGVGTAAQFNRPYGATELADGSILVADQNNNRIRRITMAGVVTTLLGSAKGDTDGKSASALLNGPQDVKVGPKGLVFIADTGNKKVKVFDGSQVKTVAGDGNAGFKDGMPLQSEFFGLEGFFVKPDGTIVVADGNGGDGSQPYNRVREIQ